jgi:hypothetical protein
MPVCYVNIGGERGFVSEKEGADVFYERPIASVKRQLEKLRYIA